MSFLPPLFSALASRRFVRRVLPLFTVVALCLSAVAARAATWTVTSTADSGTGTLRAAMSSAVSGDTIQISATGTITLASALPIMGQSVTIQGPGANALTISGAGQYGVFAVNGPTVSFSGLTIANGRGLGGSMGYGGAILIYGGTVTVNNCAFSGNSTTYAGGAIYSQGTLTVTNSSFINNSISSTSASQFGGAISNSSGPITISNSTFVGNSSNYAGGAIFDEGPITVSDSTFSGNLGNYGGAVLISTASSSITSTNNIFVANSSSGGYAGGIAVLGGTVSSESNDVFYNNTGGDGTGFTLSSTDVTGKDPLLLPLGNYGGPTQTMLPRAASPAICAGSDSLVPSGVTTDQRGFPLEASCVDAGAVQTNYLLVTTAADSGTGSLRAALNIASTPGLGDIDFAPSLNGQTITLASAFPSISGQINIVGPGAKQLTVSGNNSTAVDTIFTINSGGLLSLYGLTVANVNGSIYGAIYNNGWLTVNNGTFSGNSAQNFGGAALINLGVCAISNSTFSGNSSQLYAGAIFAGGPLTISNSTFSGNSAAAAGGAIFITVPFVTTITNSTFSGNSAETGGAAYNNNGSLTITNTILSNNTATLPGYGGGIYESAGTITSTNTLFDSNTNGDCVGCSFTPTTGAANLAPLGNYGGPTQTMPPLSGSAALGTGIFVAGESITDQRGAPRPSTAGATIDLGAVQISNEPPLILAVSPNTGPIAGGTTVTITGTGLDAATAVSFGSNPATSFVVNAATSSAPSSITATSPAGSAGTVDITVTNSSGTSTVSSNDQFTYFTPLAITPTASTTLTATYASPYSQSFAVSGGSGSYTLTNSGTLPTGLILTASAAAWTVSGTPAATGVYTFSVTATDSTNSANTITQSYTLTISAVPTINNNVPTLTYGQSGTVTVTLVSASGLASPTGSVTYAIDSGAQSTASLSSGAAALQVPGTFAVGSHTISWSYAGDSKYASIATQTITFTVTPATLNVTVNSATRAYGAANPTLTGTVIGLVNGDTATSIGLTYSTSATANSPAGPYGISATITGTNYSINVTQGTLSVSPATLNVIVNSAARAYGAANPTLTGTVTGFVNGDAVSSIGLTYSTAATTTSPATTYPITAAITSTNYSISVTQGTLTINPAALNVTINNFSRVYGAANPTLTGTVTGLVNSDTATSIGLTYSTTATTNSAANTYPITAAITSTNYSLTVTPGTLTVTAAPATVTLGNLSQIYTGSPLAATATTNPAGLTVSLTYNGSTTAPTSANSYTVTATVNDPNYQSTATGTLIIGKATPALAWTRPPSITYGTTLSATQLNASATYNGATVPGGFTYTPAAGTILAAGPQKLSASFTPTDTADYNAPPTTSNSLTVNQAGTTTSLTTSLIASATSLTPGQSLTLIAVVKSSTTGTPTGGVSFYDGTSLLGTAALNGGTASFTTSALASGITHTLSATYSGDSNFLTSTSPSSVSIPVAALDFSLNPSGTQTQTVIPGNPASFTFQVTPTYGSYPAQVTFGVAGLPPGATAVFSPANIPANGGAQTITLTIQTPSPTAQNRTLFPRGAASIALCFLLFPLFGHRRTRRGMLVVLVAALTLTGAPTLSGCGTGYGFNAQPPANYTLIVTATSAQTQHTSNVVLNVQ